MIDKNLSFEYLLDIALQDWPAEFESLLIERATSGSRKYSIEGLGVLEDEISCRYIGSQDEVLMRNIHSAIMEVVHGLSQYVIKIELSTLRRDEIRFRFERRLSEILKDGEPGWQACDLDLIRTYFSLNAS